jgi:hypothetical protein
MGKQLDADPRGKEDASMEEFKYYKRRRRPSD